MYLILAFLTAFAVIMAIGSTTGCVTTPPQVLDPEKHYARNADLEVNKVRGRSTMVALLAPRYEIRVRSAADMDFLLVTTCARELAIERAGDDFKYTFEPSLVESSRACPLKFTGIEKGASRRTVGWIDFSDPRHALGGNLCCNGRCDDVGGVSACESGSTLFQRIAFPVPTTQATVSADNPDCKMLESKDDGLTYEFRQPRGECTHVFQEKVKPLRTHRLSTYGFDETLPQKGR